MSDFPVNSRSGSKPKSLFMTHKATAVHTEYVEARHELPSTYCNVRGSEVRKKRQSIFSYNVDCANAMV